jgi:formate dehydrogenase subunit gamma
MSTINWRKRLAAGAIALAAGFALPATAQGTPAPTQTPQQDAAREQVQRQQDQPLNNAPVWREVRSGGPQTTQVRGVETNVLVQSEGETWRQIRNGPITVYGGLLILAVPLLILGFFLWKGPMRVHGALTGRKILRLTPWDRYIHWTTAISWCVLAISGLILLFGKYVLMPVIGGTLFSWLAQLAKILHNFISPVFLLAAILMFVQYVGRNIPRGHDFGWLAKGGGLLTGQHVPSGFFNAGEKIVFWVGLTFFTIVVGASGLVLLFPNFDQGREIMQLSNIVHATAAVLYMAMMMGHIYLGSVGVEGAWEAMRYDGMVDEAWAKEHHEYWYNEVKSGRQGSAAPMAGVAASRREPGETT